jgi:hypothetical protein
LKNFSLKFSLGAHFNVFRRHKTAGDQQNVKSAVFIFRSEAENDEDVAEDISTSLHGVTPKKPVDLPVTALTHHHCCFKRTIQDSLLL